MVSVSGRGVEPPARARAPGTPGAPSPEAFPSPPHHPPARRAPSGRSSGATAEQPWEAGAISSPVPLCLPFSVGIRSDPELVL